MSELIAVYGSLRRGMQANRMMESLSYVGQDAIPATLYDLGWYPGIKIGGNNTVVVDVYEIEPSSPVLERLHHYEGYDPNNWADSLFVLKRAFLKSNGKEVMCYEYNYSVANRPVVEHGDWPRYVSERNTRKAG